MLIHSVKSASKTVGAYELSDKARKLEEASGNEDADYVIANHSDLVTGYRDLAKKIM